jgi:hypothetical protein
MSESPQHFTPHHKGGQPGNTNRFRHGGYAQSRSESTLIHISSTQRNELRIEIIRLKQYMRTLYDKNIDSTDTTVIAETLHALTLAGNALVRALEEYTHVHISEPDMPEDMEAYLNSIFESFAVPEGFEFDSNL